MKRYFKFSLKIIIPMLMIVLLAFFAIKIFKPNKSTVEQKSSSSYVVERKIRKNYTKYVFVGDSRYVAMEQFANDEDIFICESGIGYDFLEEQMDNIVSICDSNTALIIGLGVNDVNYNSEKYIYKLNEMAEKMECQIFYMSVNPIDENKAIARGYQIKSSYIDEYNEKLKNELNSNIIFIDTNEYLTQTGYLTEDGLHYTDETYAKIYFFIKKEVKDSIE